MAWGALLDEGSVVGGDVSVVRVLLQHVDLQLNLLLFVLEEKSFTGCETFGKQMTGANVVDSVSPAGNGSNGSTQNLAKK